MIRNQKEFRISKTGEIEHKTGPYPSIRLERELNKLAYMDVRKMPQGYVNSLVKDFNFAHAYGYKPAVRFKVSETVPDSFEAYADYLELVGRCRKFKPMITLYTHCSSHLEAIEIREREYRLDYLVMGLYDNGYGIRAIMDMLRPFAAELKMKITIDTIIKAVRKYVKKPWTENQAEVIKELKAQDYSLRDISKQLEIPLSELSDDLTECCLSNFRSLRKDQRLELARGLRADGFSLEEIAQQTGWEIRTLRTYGITGKTKLPQKRG